MKKRLLSLLLALTLACSLLVFPANAVDVLDEGDYSSLHWVLTSDGTVTISGEGEIDSGLDNNWSQWSSMVNSINIEPGVTSIGNYAFFACSRLTSVTIPDSVTSIGNEAFYDCSSLASVTIPENVISIGNSAFYNCSSLTSVKIPDSTTSIGERAFYYCSSLTSVTIPDGITSISKEAFRACSRLTSVTIPDSVTSIGNYAFGYCRSLTSLTIPDSIINIREGAFSGCSSLKNVEIPESVTEIERSVFSGCSSLTGVTIPNSVTSIGYGAFGDCSNLTSVTIPDSVTSIGWCAFQNCTSLTSVTIPDSVTSIGSSVFKNCSSLKSVMIPASVNSIAKDAFQNCSCLTEINVDSKNKTFQSVGGVVLNKTGTQLIVFPCGRTGDYEIPESVLIITNNSFNNCSFLTNVIIPNNVLSIEEYAFTGCSGLTNVEIADGVNSIGKNAFTDCSSLKSITLPKSVTSIGSSAFANCYGLESVMIPKSVTSIGSYAFWRCESLSNVTLLANIPEIETSTFNKCYSLTNVVIPEGVDRIGTDAFRECSSLTSVTIPHSVTSIGDWAFDQCRNLQDVYYGGNEDQWAVISIGSSNNPLTSATIHFGASTPAKIETDPADAAAPVGTDVNFTVTASGDIASYQWQVKTPTGDWKNSTATGCKTDTLEITVTEARNGYQYHCIVTDVDGNQVISAPATLTVVQPVLITGSPMNCVGKAGQIAAFAVEAEGVGLTYQWQYSDNGGQSWSNSSVKAAVYTTKMNIDRNGRMVRCVVTDQYGNQAISAAATMKLEPAGVTITTQPKDYTGKLNSTATFTVAATGDGLTYQWQISNDGGKTWTNSSVKTAKYSTKLTAAKDGRQVRCIVKDANDNQATSTAAVMKVSGLTITTQPKDYVGKVNSTAKFTVAASGDGLTYQWQISDNGGKSWSNSSVKSAVYSTKLTASRDGRMVRCVVSDHYGNSVATKAVSMIIG